MSRGPTRRQFVGAASSVVAGVAFGLPSRLLSATELHRGHPVTAFFPGRRDPAELKQLAHTAIDAAMAAGATFADIRVVERRLFGVFVNMTQVGGRMGFDYSYGLRVCVNGTWGNGYGVDPTPESIAAAARAAVAQVKTLNTVPGSPAHDRPHDQPAVASAPVVTGDWATPVAIDPFTVSPEDHVAMAAALGNAVTRVRGASGSINFDWHGETRVVATSDGTVVAQSILEAMPSMQPGRINPRDPTAYRDGYAWWNAGMLLSAASAGFEITEGAALQDEFKRFAEAGVRLASYPTVANYPVGRYDAVLDGRSAGILLGGTLIPALSADRLLGQMRHREGDSFLRPIHEQLTQPVCASLVSIEADRAAPHFGAAQWDDEGVPTRTFPVVTNGNLAGIFGTRPTVAQLPSAVQDALHTMPLSGSAIAPLPTRMPTGSASAVRLAPSTNGESVESMCAGMERGVAILGGVRLSMEPNLGHGLAMPQHCFEVKDGKLTRRILGAGMQFSTRKAWQSVDVLGGAATVQTSLAPTRAGAPAVFSLIQTTTPAVQFRGVGLIDLEASVGAGG